LAWVRVEDDTVFNGKLRSAVMVKNTIGILCLGLLFAVPGFARDVESVLIVSIDALHPDALSEKTFRDGDPAGGGIHDDFNDCSGV
jgi:hypothetical protein